MVEEVLTQLAAAARVVNIRLIGHVLGGDDNVT